MQQSLVSVVPAVFVIYTLLFTESEYVKKASELARSQIGDDIDGYKANDNAIIRYNKITKDFVKSYDTGVATMFKPDGGADYFQRQKIKDGGVTDD